MNAYAVGKNFLDFGDFTLYCGETVVHFGVEGSKSFVDAVVERSETLVGRKNDFLGNAVGNPVKSLVVKHDFVVAVFLRLDKARRNCFGNGVVVNGGHSADNLLRDLVGDFVGVELGQVVGKHCRGLVGNSVLVDARNGDFLADAVSHLFVIGFLGFVLYHSRAEFFGDGVGNEFVVEFFGNFFGNGATALVVNENFVVLGSDSSYFKRDCVRKLVLVHVVSRSRGSVIDLGRGHALGNLMRKIFVVESNFGNFELLRNLVGDKFAVDVARFGSCIDSFEHALRNVVVVDLRDRLGDNDLFRNFFRDVVAVDVGFGNAEFIRNRLRERFVVDFRRLCGDNELFRYAGRDVIGGIAFL